jgi:integrase
MKKRFREPKIFKKGSYLVVRVTCPDGKRRFIKLGKDRQEANANFYNCMAQQRSNKSDYQSYRVRIGQGVETYLENKKKQLGSYSSFIRYKEMINNFKRFLDTKHPELVYMDLVQEHHISEFINFRVDEEGIAFKTSNCERSTVSNMFTYLINEKNCLTHNPVKRIKPLAERPPDEFYYDKQQTNRILEVAKMHSKKIFWYVVFAMLFFTGMRRNELRFLTWADIDFNRSRIYIRPKQVNSSISFNPKNKDIRDIPIHPELMPALKTLPRKSERWVFVNSLGHFFPQDAIRTEFRKICAEAGVPVKCQHKTRHSWASQSSESEVPLDVIQAIGGWRDSKTMNRYKHLGESHKARMFIERFTLKDNRVEMLNGTLTAQ